MRLSVALFTFVMACVTGVVYAQGPNYTYVDGEIDSFIVDFDDTAVALFRINAQPE